MRRFADDARRYADSRACRTTGTRTSQYGPSLASGDKAAGDRQPLLPASNLLSQRQAVSGSYPISNLNENGRLEQASVFCFKF